MTFLKATLIAALAAFSATLAAAHDYKIGALSIAHPFSFATPPGAIAGAGYMTITNDGGTEDHLIAVRSALPKTMIHKSEMEDGIMKMSHQKNGVAIPAGETIAFEPGGLHVMFMGLEKPFKDGEKNKVTLVFEKAGEIDVIFNVEKRKKKAMDHSGHTMPKEDHTGHSD